MPVQPSNKFCYSCGTVLFNYIDHTNTDTTISGERTHDENIARFQITVLVRFSSVWFSLVTVLLIVCPRSLLLCPFHKKKKKKKKKKTENLMEEVLRFLSNR